MESGRRAGDSSGGDERNSENEEESLDSDETTDEEMSEVDVVCKDLSHYVEHNEDSIESGNFSGKTNTPSYETHHDHYTSLSEPLARL